MPDPLGGFFKDYGDLMRQAQRQRMFGSLAQLGAGLMQAGAGGPYGSQQQGLANAFQGANQGMGQAFDPMSLVKARYMMGQMEAQQQKAAADQAKSAAAGRVQERLGGGETMEQIRATPEGRADLAAAGELDLLTKRQTLPAGFMYGPEGGIVEVPGYVDQRTRIAQAGRPSTTVNVGPTGIDYGKPPTDMAWARDAEGKVLLAPTQLPGGGTGQSPVAVPIVGGPEELERQETAAKAEARQEQRETQADIVTGEIDTALDAIGTEGLIPMTGLGGAIGSQVPGTPQYDLGQNLMTIKANLGFDRLQQMREQSPTGGALGQISNFENQTLQAAMGSLDQAQSKEQLERNLKRVRKIYEKVIHGPERMTREEASAYMKEIEEEAVEFSGPTAGDVEDGYRFKGGDPADPASWEKVP